MNRTKTPLALKLFRCEEPLMMQTIALARKTRLRMATKYCYWLGATSAQTSTLQHFIDQARAGDLTELAKQVFFGEGDIVYAVLVPDSESGPSRYDLFVIRQYDSIDKNQEILFHVQLPQAIQIESQTAPHDPQGDPDYTDKWNLIVGTLFPRLARRKVSSPAPSQRQ